MMPSLSPSSPSQAASTALAASCKSDALPWHQSFGNRLAAGLIRHWYGVKITDLGPFRAARADVLRALALEEATYGWAVEMILKGSLAGFRIVEVPVSYYLRIGDSKISGTVKGTIGAAWFILSRIVLYYFRRQPGTAGRPKPAAKFMKSSSEVSARSSGSGRFLVIMAKAPRPGSVKTRLASSLSPEAVMAQQNYPAFDSEHGQENMLVTLAAYDEP